MKVLAIIFILLLLFSLVLTVVYLGKSGFFFALRGRIRHRHVVTRSICAALGLALMALVGLGNWRAVQHSYEVLDIGTGKTVKVPEMPPPVLSKEEASSGQAPVDRFGLLVNLVVVQDKFDVARPLHAESFVIPWPEKAKKNIKREFKVGNLGFKVKLSVNDIRDVLSEDKRTIEVDYTCEVSTRVGELGDSFVSNSGSKTANTAKRSREPVVKRILSTETPLYLWDELLSSRTTPQKVSLLAFFTRVREDDPLKEVSLAEFANAHADKMDRKHKPLQPWQSFFDKTNFLNLLVSLRLSAIVLFVAAILLAQLFRLRSLALAGMLAVMVLYAAAMDYGITRSSLATMRDATASIGVQQTAVRTAESSFFHAKTSKAGVREWYASQPVINAGDGKETSSQPANK